MLLSVTITGDRAVINGLDRLAANLLPAVRRGLNRVVVGVHRDAVDWLSGARSTSPGGYPVPVLTGNLRRMNNWLRPGTTKSGPAGVFTAGANEVVVYNSAAYAATIHNGSGSSRRYGRRPFLNDALVRFNTGSRITRIIEEEIARVSP